MTKQLDIFIKGETIDLAIPTDDFALNSDWYSWMNKASVTKYLEFHGVFPNTKAKQLEYLDSNNKNKDRIVLIVTTKKGFPKGVVALSFIDWIRRRCDFACIINPTYEFRLTPFQTLEAAALTIGHGFENLGMSRISSGQHIDHFLFQQRLELLGFKLEAIKTNSFAKGTNISDGLGIACLYSDYLLIKNYRDGKIWDSFDKMKKRIKALPKDSYYAKLKKFYNKERKEYYNKIFNL